MKIPPEKMAHTLSQQTRASRLPQAYPSPSGRDENIPQPMTTLRNGANPSIWNLQSTQSTQNRDAPGPARVPVGQSWPRTSPTDDIHPGRTLASDAVSVTSTSGFSRTAEERNWNLNAWTSAELGPSTQRTAGSSPPSRALDGYLGTQDRSYGHAPRNSMSRLASLVDGDQETRGFTAGLNGTLDMDPSRRQESRAPGFRSLGDAPSRDASLPPSRGTNGSPSVQERFAFPGGHTPNNSIGVSHSALSASSPYTASPTHPGLSSRSFDSTARWVQQHDPNSTFGMQSLSLNDGPASSTNGVGFTAAPSTINGGFAAQTWQSNGPSSFVPDLAPLNGVPVPAQAGLQHPALNRGSNPGHSPASFVPGTGQYTPPQDHRSQPSSSRDLLIRPQVNGRTPPVYANQGPGTNHPMNEWFTNPYITNEILAGLQPSIYPPNTQQNFQVPTAGYPIAANSYVQGHARPHFDPGHGKDTGAELRSPLLQEYRKLKAASNNSNNNHNNALANWTLHTVWGHIPEFSGDAFGSRFIQGELETASTADKERALQEIKYDTVQLMKDLYGNYVIQKFFEIGTQGQKKALAMMMKPIFVDLSKNIYGCRVVQKVFDVVGLEQQLELIQVLKPDLKGLMCDANGNHVVQKIIDVMPREFLDFVMETMRGQIHDLSIQRFACRVVQKMLDKGTDKDRKEIFDEFFPKAEKLAANEFGNYVAQAILAKGADEDKSELITLLTPIAVSLSKQQAASNVVEKCISFGTPEQVRRLHQQFSSPGPDGRPEVVGMMLHPFGNYTIQRLFKKYGGPDEKTLTPEQVHFRAEVQMAFEMLSWDERSLKTVFSVAEALGIRIPGPPVPVSAAVGGDQRPSPTR